MSSSSGDQPAQTVRFSDVNEEIGADEKVQQVSAISGTGEGLEQTLSPEAEEEIRTISKTLQQSRCQAKRLENFSFEPVSLPPSRVSKLIMPCHFVL
jgi:hypothetical protein